MGKRYLIRQAFSSTYQSRGVIQKYLFNLFCPGLNTVLRNWLGKWHFNCICPVLTGKNPEADRKLKKYMSFSKSATATNQFYDAFEVGEQNMIEISSDISDWPCIWRKSKKSSWNCVIREAFCSLCQQYSTESHKQWGQKSHGESWEEEEKHACRGTWHHLKGWVQSGIPTGVNIPARISPHQVVLLSLPSAWIKAARLNCIRGLGAWLLQLSESVAQPKSLLACNTCTSRKLSILSYSVLALFFCQLYLNSLH